MPKEGTRRRKQQGRLFDIVLVPVGEGKEARSFRVSRLGLLLMGFAAVVVVVAATLAVLMYTPLAIYVPIPNPELEQRYGRQILETQERLNALAGDVLILRDYNRQLRKALGEESARDTSGVKSMPLPRSHEDPLATPDSLVGYTGAGVEGFLPEYPEVGGGTQGTYAPVVVTRGDLARSKFPLMIPADGFVTQGFDLQSNHFGMDFAGKRGTPVFAAADGHVLFSGWTYDDGNILIIAHGGGYVTVYKHNQTLLKTVQNRVSRGEPIALLGTSGRTSVGPHLHFEVWKDGIPQDPNDYLLTPVKRP
jgi:murein DD-endopeptidase MepM/ murein hydrolase activator NlpD